LAKAEATLLLSRNVAPLVGDCASLVIARAANVRADIRQRVDFILKNW
jgi:hypothetical protein